MASRSQQSRAKVTLNLAPSSQRNSKPSEHQRVSLVCTAIRPSCRRGTPGCFRRQIQQRLQVLAALDHPARQGLAGDIDAVTTEDFFEAVQRQTIDVFGDQQHRQDARTGHALFDQLSRFVGGDRCGFTAAAAVDLVRWFPSQPLANAERFIHAAKRLADRKRSRGSHNSREPVAPKQTRSVADPRACHAHPQASARRARALHHSERRHRASTARPLLRG